MAKFKKWIMIIGGSLLGLYLVALIASLLLVKSGEPAAFFNPRIGEHRPLVFAHQGGEYIRPTNTMIAFTDSRSLGADVLDADMHMTSDGVLILAHDETVDRTSDGTGEIRNLSLDQLRVLDFAYKFTTDDGASYPYRGQGHGVVTVEELFTEFSDIRFGIEIKQTTTEAAVKFCDLIKQFNYQDAVLVSSFAQENIDIFRNECPSVATSATTGEAAKFYFSQLFGLVGLYSPPFEALQIPEKAKGVRVLQPNTVNNARKRGLKIIPWTINEVSDFERIIDRYNVDGINTNRPDLLVDYIEASGR